MSSPVTTQLFVSDLTHIDCAYLDTTRGLLGESWAVDAKIGGELDEQGMICDFGIVKRTLKLALDELIDHRLILCLDDTTDIAEDGDQVELVHQAANKHRLRYRAPSSAICRLDAASPIPGELARALTALLSARLPDPVGQLELHLRTVEGGRQYRYCHGLKKHAGNCQRMAHGHRAALRVSVDGQRARDIETDWSERLEGRYIGTATDLAPGAPSGYHRFAYKSSQGAFELELPLTQAYVIDGDATVECLSAHIAQTILSEYGGSSAEVTAYEGIGKGAISVSRKQR